MEGPVQIGVYDPGRRFGKAGPVTIEHIFVSWVGFSAAAFKREADYAAARGRQMLVSVEPFPRPGVSPADLLPAVTRGAFDGEIDRVCSAFAASQGPIWVRWGHEMETGRYPWAGRRPAEYVAAFRHFVTRCRAQATNAIFVWSPMGERTAPLYYPGTSFVDMIGLPVWGHQTWDRAGKGPGGTFSAALEHKYARIERFGKPVLVAEMGVSGPSQYRAKWLSDVANAKSRYPLLRAAIYFNAIEPYFYPDVGSPDWRINPAYFEAATAPSA